MSNYTIRQSPLFGEETKDELKFNAFEDADAATRKIMVDPNKCPIEKIVLFQGNTITGFEVIYRGKKESIVHGFKPANEDILKLHSFKLEANDEIYAISGIIGKHKESKYSWIFRMSFAIRDKTTGEFSIKEFGKTDKMENPVNPFQSNGPIIGFAGFTKGTKNGKGIKFTGLPSNEKKNPPEFRQRVCGIAFIKRINGVRLSTAQPSVESILKKINTPSNKSAFETGDGSNGDITIFSTLKRINPMKEAIPKSAISTKNGCHMIYFTSDVDQRDCMGWAKIVGDEAQFHPSKLNLKKDGCLVASDVRYL